jgi:galactose mutarotase-like enzyme
VPRAQRQREILLTFDGLAVWHRTHIGAIAGRYANRIAGACFTLGGRRVQLAANSGPNNLHSGPIDLGLLGTDPLHEPRDLAAFQTGDVRAQR